MDGRTSVREGKRKRCWENGSSKHTHTYYISGNTMNLAERWYLPPYLPYFSKGYISTQETTHETTHETTRHLHLHLHLQPLSVIKIRSSYLACLAEWSHSHSHSHHHIRHEKINIYSRDPLSSCEDIEQTSPSRTQTLTRMNFGFEMGD